MQLASSKFPLGRLLATSHALKALTTDDMLNALNRHRIGDWGDLLHEEDRLANERALVEGSRLLSVYHGVFGVKFWIITEADRSATTILLPKDY